MDTLVIELTNPDAYRLIQELEELRIIRVIEKTTRPTERLSEKYAGKLAPEIAETLQRYIAQSRDEWENQGT